MNSKRVLVWEPEEQNWTKQKSSDPSWPLGRRATGGARMFINNNYDSLIITGSNLQVHLVGTCHRGNVEA